MALSRVLPDEQSNHLLIETQEPNLLAGMRRLSMVSIPKPSISAVSVGRVFQGRYKSTLVDKVRTREHQEAFQA